MCFDAPGLPAREGRNLPRVNKEALRFAVFIPRNEASGQGERLPWEVLRKERILLRGSAEGSSFR